MLAEGVSTVAGPLVRLPVSMRGAFPVILRGTPVTYVGTDWHDLGSYSSPYYLTYSLFFRWSKDIERVESVSKET